MKIIITILLSLFCFVGYSQDELDLDSQEPVDSTLIQELENEIKSLRGDGFLKLSMGLFGHVMGAFLLTDNLKDPNAHYPFIIYNSIGITFDIFAIIQFSKARKKKKELKTLLE